MDEVWEHTSSNLNDKDAQNGNAAVVKYMRRFQQRFHVLLVVVVVLFTALADVMRFCRRRRWRHGKCDLLVAGRGSFALPFGDLRLRSAMFGKVSMYHSPDVTFKQQLTGSDSTNVLIYTICIRAYKLQQLKLKINPLISTLKPPSNGPLYSNTVIGTLAVKGWAVTFGTARRELGGLRPRQVPSSLYRMNSRAINGQCTNVILFDVALYQSIN